MGSSLGLFSGTAWLEFTLLSIILIDSTGRRGGVVKILETAAEQQLGAVIEVMSPDKFQRTMQDRSLATAAIFVPVSEAGSFSANDSWRAKSLADSFAFGQLAATRAAKVIWVNQPGASP